MQIWSVWKSWCSPELTYHWTPVMFHEEKSWPLAPPLQSAPLKPHLRSPHSLTASITSQMWCHSWHIFSQHPSHHSFSQHPSHQIQSTPLTSDSVNTPHITASVNTPHITASFSYPHTKSTVIHHHMTALVHTPHTISLAGDERRSRRKWWNKWRRAGRLDLTLPNLTLSFQIGQHVFFKCCQCSYFIHITATSTRNKPLKIWDDGGSILIKKRKF